MLTIGFLVSIHIQMDPEIGKGKGAGLPEQVAGGRDFCVCKKCGQKHIHPRGKPCTDFACVKCGARLSPM